MTFWQIVLAIFVGFWLYDISGGVVKVLIRRFEDRRDERKIGFGGDSEPGIKKSKGATMRKIGFGAND